MQSKKNLYFPFLFSLFFMHSYMNGMAASKQMRKRSSQRIVAKKPVSLRATVHEKNILTDIKKSCPQTFEGKLPTLAKAVAIMLNNYFDLTGTDRRKIPLSRLENADQNLLGKIENLISKKTVKNITNALVKISHVRRANLHQEINEVIQKVITHSIYATILHSQLLHEQIPISHQQEISALQEELKRKTCMLEQLAKSFGDYKIYAEDLIYKSRIESFSSGFSKMKIRKCHTAASGHFQPILPIGESKESFFDDPFSQIDLEPDMDLQEIFLSTHDHADTDSDKEVIEQKKAEFGKDEQHDIKETQNPEQTMQQRSKSIEFALPL